MPLIKFHQECNTTLAKIFLTVCLLATAGRCLAFPVADYLPLNAGNNWTYLTDGATTHPDCAAGDGQRERGEYLCRWNGSVGYVTSDANGVRHVVMRVTIYHVANEAIRPALGIRLGMAISGQKPPGPDSNGDSSNAILHDYGKIGIDDCVLKKNGKLNESELTHMK